MSDLSEVAEALSKGKKFYLTRIGLAAFILIPFLATCGAITYAELKPAKVIVEKEVRVEVQEVLVYRYLPKDSKETPLIDADGDEKNLFKKEAPFKEGEKYWLNDEIRSGTFHIRSGGLLYKSPYIVIRGSELFFWEWKSGRFHWCNGNWDVSW